MFSLETNVAQIMLQFEVLLIARGKKYVCMIDSMGYDDTKHISIRTYTSNKKRRLFRTLVTRQTLTVENRKTASQLHLKHPFGMNKNYNKFYVNYTATRFLLFISNEHTV